MLKRGTETRRLAALCALLLTTASPVVVAQEDPLAADAGEDRVVGEGVVVTLDGTNSTPKGSITYAWRQREADEIKVTLIEDAETIARTGIVTFTAPTQLERDVHITFVLTATDARGIFLTDEVTITARAADFDGVFDSALLRVGHSLALNAVDAISGRFVDDAGSDAVQYAAGDAALSMNSGLPGVLGKLSLADTARCERGARDYPSAEPPTERALGTTHAWGAAAASKGHLGSWTPDHFALDAHFRSRMLAWNPASGFNPMPEATLEFGMPKVGIPKIRLPKIGRKRDTPRDAPPVASSEGCPEESQWAFWGHGDVRGFDDQGAPQFTMRGEVISYYLGMDYRWNDQSVAGVAVSRSETATGWREGTTDGDVDVQVQAIYPYVKITPSDGNFDLWGMIGQGGGEAKVTTDFGVEKTTDMSYSMGVMGLRTMVVDGFDMDVFAKADVLVVNVSSDQEEILGEADASVNQLRLAMEGRGSTYLSNMAYLQPMFEVGLRFDGGDRAGGVGLELGGGLAYVNTDLGLVMEARGRRLVMHARGGIDDWSGGFLVRYKPLPRCGIGMSFSPTWGGTNEIPGLAGTPLPGTDALGPGNTATAGYSTRPDLELHYNLELADWGLTPYGGFDFIGGEQRLRLGLRLGALNMPSGELRFNLFGDRVSKLNAIDHDVGLEARFRLSLP